MIDKRLIILCHPVSKGWEIVLVIDNLGKILDSGVRISKGRLNQPRGRKLSRERLTGKPSRRGSI